MIAAVLVLLFVILVQNTPVVSIQFFFWNISMSRIILILFVLLIGFILGYFFAKKR